MHKLSNRRLFPVCLVKFRWQLFFFGQAQLQWDETAAIKLFRNTPFLQDASVAAVLSFLHTSSVELKGNDCKSVLEIVKKTPSTALTVSQVKVVGGTCRPQPHGVYSVVHVAGDGCVVRHRQNNLQPMWPMCKQWGNNLGIKDGIMQSGI